MYKRLLYSNSLILTYYFILSFLIFFAVNVAHHSIIKRSKQIAQRQSQFGETEIADSNIILPENSKYSDEAMQEPDANTAVADTQPKLPYKKVTLNPGDTVSAILEQSGISQEESVYIVSSISTKLNLRKISAGSEVTIYYVTNGTDIDYSKVDKVVVSTGSNFKYEAINFGNNNYQSKMVTIPVEKFFVKKEVTIGSSFINSATKAGIPRNIALSLVKVFSYDIDFQRDIKQGDRIEVLYDKFYTQEGKFSHNGSVQFAALKLKNRTLEIYKHVNSHGEEQFYDKEGKTIVKTLLRTPINAARISSSFGMRMHPVLGYSRMHKGVDFAAPIGTPILAAGNGVVEFKGTKSGYGKYLKIRHNNIFSTAYAHISKFPASIKVGSRVKQGQVVAYVGNTGLTSGPHLHYEVHKHGVEINPQSLKFTSIGEKLAGVELKKLKKTIDKVNYVKSKFNLNQTEIKVSSFGKDLEQVN
jgi:murein DD-endopeptidase MepM/ murein hydrolase activator NlpD